jgi:hypothetical protein
MALSPDGTVPVHEKAGFLAAAPCARGLVEQQQRPRFQVVQDDD